MHSHGIVHELKIKDETPLLPQLTPAAGALFTLNSCDTSGPRGIEFSLVAAQSQSYFVLKLDCQIHHHQLSSI